MQKPPVKCREEAIRKSALEDASDHIIHWSKGESSEYSTESFKELTLASRVDAVISGDGKVVQTGVADDDESGGGSVLNLERLSRTDESHGRSEKEGEQETSKRKRLHIFDNIHKI
jgi:hypothetical protein